MNKYYNKVLMQNIRRSALMQNYKKGTLVLIIQDKCMVYPGNICISPISNKYIIASSQFIARKAVIPIIVCDDEIKEGNLTYHAQEPGVYYPKNGGLSGDKKVLVNTPQIPDNIIQAITLGELKDGDKVFVEKTKVRKWECKTPGLCNENTEVLGCRKCEYYKTIVTIPETENNSSILYTEGEVVNLLYKLYGKLVFREQVNINIHSIKEVDNWFDQHKKK